MKGGEREISMVSLENKPAVTGSGSPGPSLVPTGSPQPQVSPASARAAASPKVGPPDQEKTMQGLLDRAVVPLEATTVTAEIIGIYSLPETWKAKAQFASHK